MVKGVVGEEAQLKLAEDRLRQSAIPAEVGLVIGNLSSTLDGGFIFDLIPTPHNDSGEPACVITDASRDDKKKGSMSKSHVPDSPSLFIYKDWVAEHARQTVKGVAEAAPILECDWDERLLVHHICHSPSRWNCRNFTLSSNITSSSLRPCDFKMGKVLSSFQTYRLLRMNHANQMVCMKLNYFFHLLTVFLLKGDIIMSLQSRLDIICDEADGDSGSGHDSGREVSDEMSTEKHIAQRVLQLLSWCLLSFFPQSATVIAFWTGMSPPFSYKVLKDYCTELLSMKDPPDTWTILEPEKEAPSLVTKSFWDVGVPFHLSIQPLEEKSRPVGGGENSGTSVKPVHVSIFATIIILPLSILVGFVRFVLKG